MQASARRPLASAVALLCALAACGPAPSAGSPAGPVPVVAVENFWGDVTAQIGGPHVRVTSLIVDPTADPHEYTSSTADALAVANAKLVVQNGLGYDDFAGRLLAASPSSARRVLVLGQALHITGVDPNPHIWYDVRSLPAVARDIAAELEQVDPADAPDIRGREATFERSLDPLRAVVAQIRRAHAGERVAYTERVPGYLLADAGLRNLTPPAFAQAVEGGNDPSVQAVAAMEALITTRSCRVLLYNSQTTSPLTQRVRDLARASRVPIVGVSETLPPATSFQAWQLSQARALLTALG